MLTTTIIFASFIILATTVCGAGIGHCTSTPSRKYSKGNTLECTVIGGFAGLFASFIIVVMLLNLLVVNGYAI